MFCNSCKLEIPPEFSHAITNNFCPRCGKTLMDEQTQELMTNLSQAMQQMSDPIAIVSWLMSNYKLQKIGEYDPVITKQVAQKVQQDPKQESKYDSIIAHIHKASGLDKSKNISSKQVIDERESSAYKESFVEAGPELDSEEEAQSTEDYSSNGEVDEIDEMMSSPQTQGNNSLQNVIQQIKAKQISAKENILSGTPSKNSFTRVS